MTHKRWIRWNEISIFWAIAMIVLSGTILAQTAANEPLKPFPVSVRLGLPPRIYAVPGIEMNVYFDNVCLTVNPANFAFDVTCAKGKQQVERWTLVATDQDVGEYPFILEVRDEENHIVARAESTLQVVPRNAAAGVPLSVLIIGDSLTHMGYYPDQLLELCNANSKANPQITLIGHVPKGQSDPREGYGGWTAERFMTQFKEGARPEGPLDWKEWNDCGSPFLYSDGKGSFKPDFNQYCREFNGGKGPDIVTIFLGVNDNFGANDENIDASIDAMFKYEDMMIDMIRQVRKNTKIGIFLTVPPAASQDAFGANYQCGQTRWQYKRNQHRVVERLIKKYGGRESEFIYLVPTHVNLDTANNYPSLKGPLNSRNEVEGVRLNNAVHPSNQGQRQIGDTLYSWLKATVSMNAPKM